MEWYEAVAIILLVTLGAFLTIGTLVIAWWALRGDEKSGGNNV